MSAVRPARAGEPDAPQPIASVSADAYRQAKDTLREVVVRRGRQGQLRLPSEDVLSAELGVSRATVRSVLQSLQKEGYVRRLHGHGTFVNKHALDIGPDLSKASPFVDLIAEAGMQPTAHTVDQRVVRLDSELAAALEVPAATDALRIERVFAADGVPVVHGVDHVPVALLGDDPERRNPGQSTFEFVETNLGLPICYSVAEVRAVLPPAAVAKYLRLRRGRPVLRLRHTHIRADEVPVAATSVHVNDDVIHFSVVRTFLDQ